MWQGILGHDEVVERFRRSLQAGRLASSYLFLGPPGVGKRTLALKLARALLCHAAEPASLEPCGNCESCRQADSRTHPDISLVGLPEGKRMMPVELFLGDRDHRNQQGLCHDIALRPMLGRRRVAVIDDADHLTTESSNCLLKTLEEPPVGAVLILLAASRSRLLPTILSRTQIVRFAGLPTAAIQQVLLQKGIAPDEPEAERLASLCNGSLQRARELAEADHWEIRNWLLPQLRPSAFDSQIIARQLHDYVSGAGKEAHAKRQRQRLLFQMVAEYFREVLRGSAIGSAGETASSEHIGPAVSEFGPTGADAALAVLDRCLKAEDELDRNANQATLLECWLDDLARILSSTCPASTN